MGFRERADLKWALVRDVPTKPQGGFVSQPRVADRGGYPGVRVSKLDQPQRGCVPVRVEADDESFSRGALTQPRLERP